MKDTSKPSGKLALVDAKPISIPMISSTSGGTGVGSSSSSSSPSPVVIAAVAAAAAAVESNPGSPEAELVITVKSISRSLEAPTPAGKVGMVSRGTQTQGEGEGMPEDLQEKRRLIRKQLAVLLHAVLCRVRDELIGNTGENARACPTAYCGLMKNVLNHLRICEARQDCPHPHCLSSRQILSHWKSCTQADCPVCSSLRRVVPAYLDAVVSNPRWRGEIMARFNWLITFIGPISMRPVNSVLQIPPQALEQQRAELEAEEVRSHTKDAEE